MDDIMVNFGSIEYKVEHETVEQVHNHLPATMDGIEVIQDELWREDVRWTDQDGSVHQGRARLMAVGDDRAFIWLVDPGEMPILQEVQLSSDDDRSALKRSFKKVL